MSEHLCELRNLPPPDSPITDSDDTLSYGAWNKDLGSALPWADFEEVSKPNVASSSDRGKGPLGDDKDDQDPSYVGDDKDEDEDEDDE
jgi:hypothetical protein